MTSSSGRRRSIWAAGGAAVLVAGVALAAAGASWANDGLVATALDPGLPTEVKVERVREAVAAAGVLAPLLYVAFVTVEVVVAPLPGFLLYGPGGALFGGFLGGALALAGNLLGAAIAFTLTRRLGRERARRWLEDSELGALESRLADRGLLVVFLLRLNPLTSSDVVSYAAGLSSMSAGRMLAGTALGLAPLCWVQAYLAEGLLARFPWLLYPAVAAALAYVGFGVWLGWRVAVRGRARN